MSQLARITAPRLANGDSRVRYGGGLPNAIKEGLRAIARKENKSMSWVMECVIIDYFSLPHPHYKGEKPKRKRTRR